MSRSSFHAAARQLALRTDFQRMRWQHHVLGMLKAEFDEGLRIHVWHPRLRVLPLEGLRDVHDHRFDLTSAVIVGTIYDIRYYVEREALGDGWTKTELWELRHGVGETGSGCSTATDAVKLGDHWTYPYSRSHYPAGKTYRISARAFHTTRVTDLAITVVHRSNFDDGRLARVLGDASGGKSPIVPDSPEERSLRDSVLQDAEAALAKLAFSLLPLPRTEQRSP